MECNLPDTLEYIGDYAFWGCRELEITIPKSVKNFGLGAFSGIKKARVYRGSPAEEYLKTVYKYTENVEFINE